MALPPKHLIYLQKQCFTTFESAHVGSRIWKPLFSENLLPRVYNLIYTSMIRKNIWHFFGASYLFWVFIIKCITSTCYNWLLHYDLYIFGPEMETVFWRSPLKQKSTEKQLVTTLESSHIDSRKWKQLFGTSSGSRVYLYESHFMQIC